LHKCKNKLNVYVSFLLFSVLKMCFESLRDVFVYSDNQFGFKRGLSSSRAIYTVKSVVNETNSLLWHFVRIPPPGERSYLSRIPHQAAANGR